MVTPKFSFVGGALCLDFVNTVGGHDGTTILRDKLARLDDMKRWASLAGVPDEISIHQFRRAIALREALFRIFRSATRKKAPPGEDLDVLNKEMFQAEQRVRYHRGSFRLATPDALGAIARSAVELLTSGDLSRLRQCSGEGCGWLFLDTSRNGSRQWCDMRICGNRAKARKFRRKKRHNRNREA